MWFKNLQIYRLTTPWTMTSEQLEAALSKQEFTPCSSSELQSQGWQSPRGNGKLVHTVNRQMLLQLDTEKKLLPSTVVNQVTKARAAELEDQQGFKPGRKQMKELKEQVADELLPRAFSIQRSTRVWIDPVNGWLVVDAASPAKADEVFKLLLKSLEVLPFASLRTVRSPLSAMTDWLAADEAPAGFTVDQDTELRATNEGKATVRYVRHTIEAADVRRHISAGKQVTRLALTWSDRISFVLTDALSIKRIAPLDVLKENDATTANDDERFDTDFALMTGELGKLLHELVAALGGEGAPEKGQLDIDDIPAIEAEKQEAAADAESEEFDSLFQQAVDLTRSHKRASISLIQRHLRLGYNRAARMVERMEAEGIVSKMDSAGNRTIIAPDHVSA